MGTADHEFVIRIRLGLIIRPWPGTLHLQRRPARKTRQFTILLCRIRGYTTGFSDFHLVEFLLSISA